MESELTFAHTTSVGILEPYLLFRGKAQPAEGAVCQWHPVAYHCLDVTACLEAILDARPQTLARSTHLLRMSNGDARRLLRVLAVLHDIGKFSEAFFGQDPDLWPSSLGPYDAGHPKRPHTAAGYALWRDRLRKGLAERIARGDIFDFDPLFVAAFGHHGRPLSTAQHTNTASYFASVQSLESSASCASDLIALVCERPIETPAGFEETARRASWWVAGVISISDWMGSSQRWFPYREPVLDLAAYWEYARSQAAIAVSEAGLVQPAPAKAKGFTELTGVSKQTTPLQRWALNVELPKAEGLFIIEDVTGAGKTEAAQIIVNRLMAGGRASGAYWGMPTQATANAMYERQNGMIGALFDPTPEHLPSLVLSHGQAKFHERFRSTVLDFCAPPKAAIDSDDEETTPGTTACAAFLADDRRAGLLADIGAGTIDQVLLGVLPSKFNTIRLFGLAEKVLVLDEVHAYDAYMREEIVALLRFHSALGGSAIVLSATLPAAFRRSLLTAWRSGTAEERSADSPGTRDVCSNVAAYPLATVVDGAGAPQEHAIPAAAWSTRRVPVRLLHETSDAVDRIYNACKRGEAVAWIRNTVDSCLEAAGLLRARGIEPMVFHARFAQCDRQTREAEVLAAFGSKSTRQSRNRVLVATQVVEQSLDLDFDTLVTDLAPIDLLIQRAGRLWRHPWRESRPAGGERELVVLTPRYADEPGKNWLDSVLPKTKNVYEDVGVLWRTLRLLTNSPVIDTPGGVRGLVESVYSDDFTPASLERDVDRAEGKAKAHGATARNFALRFADGYCGDYYAGWYSDVHVPTRLIDEQTVIRLGKVGAHGAITPWAEGDASDWRAWALSEVRISARKVVWNASVPPAYQPTVDAIQMTWPRYERDVLLVPMVSSGDEWFAEVTSSGSLVSLAYSTLQGLRL